MSGPIERLVWLYDTLRDLRAASADVRETLGNAIRTAQGGGMSVDAKPMKGPLRNVVEIRADDADGTYRLMYTTKIGDRLYILDYFQKKGNAGGATSQVDLDRVLQRYKRQKAEYEAEIKKRG